MQQASQKSRIERFCSRQNLAAEQPLSTLLRPKKPNRTFDTTCISVVKTMLERCKKEKSLNHLQVPLDDHVQRVSFYTGLPATYLTHLVTEEDTAKKPKIVDLIVILKCLKNVYSKKEYQSLKELFDLVLLFRQRNNMEVVDYAQFCYQMKSLHFCERPTTNGIYLFMEDPKVTFDRFNYLSRLEKYRNKDMYIYYLDERIIGNSHSLSSNNMMLFYAVLKNDGYVRGLYCTNPDKNDCMKWITNILLPLLIPSSLVIMSDGPFHETTTTNITRYHSKAEMLKWLTAKGVPCSDKMHKAELYELISKFCLKCEESNIECVLKAHGHEVLFRPVSLKECTPTEAFWNDLTSELCLTTEKSDNPKLQDKIQTYINSLTQLQWVGYEQPIVKQEKLLLSLDQQIQENLENYKLDTAACESFSDEDDYDIIIK